MIYLSRRETSRPRFHRNDGHGTSLKELSPIIAAGTHVLDCEIGIVPAEVDVLAQGQVLIDFLKGVNKVRKRNCFVLRVAQTEHDPVFGFLQEVMIANPRMDGQAGAGDSYPEQSDPW